MSAPRGGRRSGQVQLEGKRRELDPYLNCTEAGAHTGLSTRTIGNAVQRREMTVRRSHPQGPFYIRLSELERWFAAHYPEVPAL